MVERVAIVHDYLTQRGGAERVTLSFLRAFPDARLYTSLYAPTETFPDFADQRIETSGLNRWAWFRQDHRRALPFYRRTFDRMHIDAQEVICSSSGWAHGVRTSGRKIVYCHTPARWLDQPERYLREIPAYARLGFGALRPRLDRWDRQAATSADVYLANSTAVKQRIRDRYGIDAQLVPPPFAVRVQGAEEPLSGLPEDFLLSVSRLSPYKNLDAVLAAFRRLPDLHLVIVGTGPDRDRLVESAPDNVTFAGVVDDDQLRWLYANCTGLVTASHEDYGLTPLEAAAFGRPTAALAFGGFLDTVVPDRTGVLFDAPDPARIAAAVERLANESWVPSTLQGHAEGFSEERFVARIRNVVHGEVGETVHETEAMT